MAEKKRIRKQWSTTTDPELYRRFKKLSVDTRIASTILLDEAIEDLLLKYRAIDHKTKTP